MRLRTLPTWGGIALAAGLAVAGTTVPATAKSIACPVPHADSGPDVLKETPLQLAETGSYLASSSDPNRVPEVAADLRKRYPGVSDGEIQNYLVAAYCPQVAKLNGLSLAEQQARVSRFARQVSAMVHGS